MSRCAGFQSMVAAQRTRRPPPTSSRLTRISRLSVSSAQEPSTTHHTQAQSATSEKHSPGSAPHSPPPTLAAPGVNRACKVSMQRVHSRKTHQTTHALNSMLDTLNHTDTRQCVGYTKAHCTILPAPHGTALPAPHCTVSHHTALRLLLKLFIASFLIFLICCIPAVQLVSVKSWWM